jgi:hypothetical protein
LDLPRITVVEPTLIFADGKLTTTCETRLFAGCGTLARELGEFAARVGCAKTVAAAMPIEIVMGFNMI